MQGIEIIYDHGEIIIKSQFDRYNKPAKMTEEEKKFIDVLKTIIDTEMKIVRRSDNYLTVLVLENETLMRFHVGKKVCWFSIQVDEKYIYDERLKDVKNKNQFFWRIDITKADDLKNYSDIIESSFRNI